MESTFCVLKAKPIDKGDTQKDHSVAATILAENIAKLQRWLRAPHNQVLSKALLQLEKGRPKEKQFFYEIPGEGITIHERLNDIYFHDMDNLVNMCPSANLLKGKKRFYDILYHVPHFGEKFRQAVDERNHHKGDVQELIVEKVGGKHFLTLRDDNNQPVKLSKGGIGLGRFARDWFIKEHGLLVATLGEINKQINILHDNLIKAWKVVGRGSIRMVNIAPQFGQLTQECAEIRWSPPISPPEDSQEATASGSTTSSSAALRNEVRMAIGKAKENIHHAYNIALISPGINDMSKMIFRLNTLELISDALKQHQVHNEKGELVAYYKSERFQAFCRYLEEIDDGAFLKEIRNEAYSISKASKEPDTVKSSACQNRFDYCWQEISDKLFKKVEAEALKKIELEQRLVQLEEENPALRTALTAAEQQVMLEKQGREEEKRKREEAEQKLEKLKEELKRFKADKPQKIPESTSTPRFFK